MSVSHSASSNTAIVFIDRSVPGFDQLAAAVKPGTEVVLLDASEDGLQQIAQALAGRSGIDAIHVLSHGSAGALALGSAQLTLDTLAIHGKALGAIRAALADDADLLLYGCDMAQGAQGQAFIEALAAATGADVAASTDLTGSALLGGDWELEAVVGQVETASLGSDGALAAYGGKLGPQPNSAPTITDYFSTSVATGMPSRLPDYKVDDVDDDQLTVTLTATNGLIGGVVDADDVAPGIQLTGSASGINADLAQATFTAASNGAASVTISVSDGKGGNPVTATSWLAATSPAPSITSGIIPGSAMPNSDISSLVTGADGNMYMPAFDPLTQTVSILRWDGRDWSTAATLSATELGYGELEPAVTLGVDQYGKIHVLTLNDDGKEADAWVKLAIHDGTEWSYVEIEHLQPTGTKMDDATITVSGASIVVTSDNVVNIAYHRVAGSEYDSFQTRNIFITNASGNFTSSASDVGIAAIKTVQQFAGPDGHSYVLHADHDNGALIIHKYLGGDYVDMDVAQISGTLVGAVTDDSGQVVIVTGYYGQPLLAWTQENGTWKSGPIIENPQSGHEYAPYAHVDTHAASGRTGLVKGQDGNVYLAIYEDDGNQNYTSRILRLEDGAWVDGKTTIDEFNLLEGLSFAVDASGNIMIVNTYDFDVDLSYIFGHDSDFEYVASLPVFVSAAVDGTSLVMTYDRVLDEAHPPATEAFAVTADGETVKVIGVTVDGAANTVTLMLELPVTKGQSIMVGYADPSGDNDSHAIQDAAGNDAAALTPTIVVNDTRAQEGVAALFTFDTVSGPGRGTLEGVDFSSKHGDYDLASPEVRLNIDVADVSLIDAKSLNQDNLPSENALFIGMSGETSATFSISPAGHDPSVEVPPYPFDLSAFRIVSLLPMAQTLRVTADTGAFIDIVLDPAPQGANPGAGVLDFVFTGSAFQNIVSFTITALTDVNDAVDGMQASYWIDNIAVENIIIPAADTTAPALTSAVITGTSLVLTYDEALDDVALLAGSFTVNVGGHPAGISNVAMDAANGKVTLTLTGAVQPNQSVTVSYADTSGGGTPIQDTAGNDAANLVNHGVTNNSEDTLAPALESAIVTGNSLVLTYDEALDNVALMAGSFTVNVGGSPAGITNVALDAANGKVTLTLASAVQPNQSVTVSYADTSGGSTPIQDTSGNDAANLVNQVVTNNSGDTLAPTLESAVVDGTSLVLTYNEALDLTQQPGNNAFQVKIGNTTVSVTNVALDGNAGTVTLTLATAAQPGDSVTVSYMVPSSGGVIQDAAGIDAAGLTNQVVDNESSDTKGPVLLAAAVTGTALALTYDEALDEDHGPEASDFVVMVDGQPAAVSGVDIDPLTNTVKLTLENAVQPGQEVTVSYLDPTAGDDESAIQDALGNDAASLENQEVYNDSDDTLGPVLESATVDGTALVLTYGEMLDSSHGPKAGDFVVKVDGHAVSVSDVIVDLQSNTVRLTLANAVQPNQVVLVSYLDPTDENDGDAIQDMAGNDAASLVDRTVTNDSTDTLAPTFVSAAVNGRTLVMTYSEALDASHLPSGSAFVVNVGGSQVAVSNVAVNASAGTVTLTLASSVQQGQAVTVSYLDPTDNNDDHAIQDTVGNDAASVQAREVTNNTPAAGGGNPPVNPPLNPPVDSNVDGVKVVTEQVRNPDGSTSTRVTIPVVTESRQEQVGNNDFADIPLATNAGGGLLLQAQLPVGYGMTSSGSGIKTAGDALTDLIREIKAHTAAGSTDQEALTGGGSGFIGDLASSTALLVQTIVPVVSGATPPGAPLVIAGMPSAQGNPQTALVIDSSQLPGGTQLKLDNVDFAAIIGAVNVSGGAGSQKVWGDSASQTIFLGEGDDVLHGGGGDDIVGSAGGNDRVYGDDGDDIVFGGEGDDYVDGGSGRDIAVFSGAGREGYSLRVKDGQLVMKDLHGSDGTDTVVDVEVLRFTGAPADTTVRGTVARLIEAASGARASDAAIDTWIDALDQGADPAAVAGSLLAANGLDKLGHAGFIDALYDNVLGRAADAAGKAFWVAALDAGTIDQAGAVLLMADSAEKLALGESVDLDFNHSDVATLVRMYETLFARHADEDGLNFWIGLHESGAGMTQLADWFVASGEAADKYGALTDARFIDALYLSAFDRVGSAGEQAFWLDGLASGQLDRGDVLLGFADSQEMLTLVGAIDTSMTTV